MDIAILEKSFDFKPKSSDISLFSYNIKLFQRWIFYFFIWTDQILRFYKKKNPSISICWFLIISNYLNFELCFMCVCVYINLYIYIYLYIRNRSWYVLTRAFLVVTFCRSDHTSTRFTVALLTSNKLSQYFVDLSSLFWFSLRTR